MMNKRTNITNNLNNKKSSDIVKFNRINATTNYELLSRYDREQVSQDELQELKNMIIQEEHLK
jgi:hypothetical protein